MALRNSGESFWAASRAQRKRGCIAAASRSPALQLLLGQGLEKLFIHATLQEPQLAAGAGIDRQQQGGEVVEITPPAGGTSPSQRPWEQLRGSGVLAIEPED